MFASTVFPSAMLRVSTVALALFLKFLMVAGLVFVIGLIGVQVGHAGLIDSLKSLSPPDEVVLEEEYVVADTAPATQSFETLSPKMRSALAYVSRRYHVSTKCFAANFCHGSERRPRVATGSFADRCGDRCRVGF